MKMTICPLCRVLHQSIGPDALASRNAEQLYWLTHCRHCELPVQYFYKGEVDAEDLKDDEIGYPSVMLPDTLLGPEELEKWVIQVEARMAQSSY